MSQPKPSSEDRIKKFFEKKINESGHPFEEFIEKELENEGFRITSEFTYLDSDESKGREIDIVAIDTIPTNADLDQITFGGELRLVIECKNLPDHAWIFFGENNVSERHDFVPSYKEFSSFSLEYSLSTIGIPFVKRYSEYILDTGKSKIKSNKKDNNLYEAILNVVKATRHNVDSFLKESRDDLKMFKNLGINVHLNRPLAVFSFLQSAIVFNGRMYMAKQTSNGQWFLESVNQVQVKKSYISKNYNEVEGQVHIIHYQSLGDYIKKVRAFYYNKNTKNAVQDQKHYKDIFDRIQF